MSRDRDRFEEVAKKIKRELGETKGGMGRRPIINPQGLVLNTITPCAACKLLRRRCAEECPFSPYFSPHEPQKFAAVHKVFGASNVSKMLMEVPESQRADTANSLVYEANLRLRDPVYGCMGAISALHQQIQSLQLELNSLRAEIIKYKYREATNSNIAETLSSIVAPPPPPPPPQPQPSQSPVPLRPPPPPPPPSSVIVSSPSSSSNISSLYTPPTSSSTGYSSNISSVNVPYFD